MDNPNCGRNLGFFFDQATARVPDKVAIIDLFGGPGALHHLPAARRADGSGRAHAGAARRARGRARGHAGREPHRVHRVLLRIDARRARSRFRSTRGSLPARSSTSSPMPAACWRSSILRATATPSRSRRACRSRHRLLLDQSQDGFLVVRGRDGKARARRSRRLPSRTMPRPSSPTRQGRPAGPRARS